MSRTQCVWIALAILLQGETRNVTCNLITLLPVLYVPNGALSWCVLTARLIIRTIISSESPSTVMHAQDADDESQMPNAWKMDAGEEPVKTQEPRL